ncbi:MAG: ABC transporter permease [Egibacteraceae bacterium]
MNITDHTSLPHAPALKETAAPAPPARPGLRQTVRHSLVLTRRNLAALVRKPETIVLSVIQPIMILALFNYVLGGAINPGGDYIDFIVPGMMVWFVAFATVGTALGLNADLTKGFIDRFRSLPIARSAVLTGRILSDTVVMTFSVVLLTGVGMLMGFRISGSLGAAVGAFLLVIAFGIALLWVGAWIGLSLGSPEAVQSGGMIWLFPLTFASSAFVPAATMPGWLQTVVNVNPVTLTIDALRALLSGEPATALVLRSLAWTAAITLVFFTLAVRRYRRMQ